MVMNKIEQQLAEIKKRKRIGLMAHVVVGYPTLQETIATVKTMASVGVDFVELQIPFSDPLADGPTIMKACEASLANGTKVSDAFAVMRKLTTEVSIPLLFMAYYNTVFHYGVEKFCRDAQAAGASGLIIPDMPIDEEKYEHFYAFAKKYQLTVIHVVSPASTPERLKKNAAIAKGFVYCTARQGTTGAKEQLPDELASFLQRVKSVFAIPVAVGFGIAKRQHLEILQKHADVAVVGSAVIDVIARSEKGSLQLNIKRFFEELMIQ